MEPKIIFEDEDLLIIDKLSGMTVNKAETTRGEKTVQDWIEAYRKQNGFWTSPATAGSRYWRGQNDVILGRSKATTPESNDHSDFLSRAGIVHRLDKETSGILLIAKNAESFERLQKQFKERTVKKKYLALVHGEVKPKEGEIRVPVGRLPWNRERFGVIPGGRESVTKYKAISNYVRHSGKPKAHPESNEILKRVQDDSGDSGQARMTHTYSLLELQPLTGRTHQIRVHLKYMGHPVVGDLLYAGRKQARDDRKWCPRLFLHAAEITFRHSRTEEEMNIRSQLPRELQSVLNGLHTNVSE